MQLVPWFARAGHIIGSKPVMFQGLGQTGKAYRFVHA